MDGYVVIGTELDTKSFDAQIDYVKSQMEEIEYLLEKADAGEEIGKNTLKLEAQYEILTEKLKNLVRKKQELEQPKKIDFSGVKESIDNVGKSVQKTTKKIGKMALAVFGIRSAFMFIRSAINTIAGDDEQLKADIDYMKNAIAYTLEPVVRGIVNLAKQLMFYVAYIIKAWTGKNIFENANKGLDSANKKAKQLQKTTSSFDEMNVLSDSSSSGTTAPSFDLTKPEDYPVPSWLEWIADHGDEVKSILLGIAAGLIAIKLGLTGIQALGIGLAIAGIAYTIQKIIDFINDPTFENFIGILEGIAVAVLGVAIAIGAWPVAVGAAVALGVLLIVQFFDDIVGIFDALIDWIDTGLRKILTDLFGPFGDVITDIILSVVNFAKGAFQSFFGGIKSIINGIVKLFKGDFKGAIVDVFNGIKGIVLAPLNALISGLNVLIKGVNKVSFDVPSWVPIIGGKKWGFNIPQIPKLARGGIVNNPGPGVMMGSYVAGERGPEAVLPLTDDTLQKLANMIPITVNVTNTMNGRVISRELQKVQNNRDFAYNR